MKFLRLLAAYIDNMCVAVCCLPLFLLVIDRRSAGRVALLGACYLTLFILRDALRLSLGKRLMRFEVCRADTGEGATVPQRILRNLTLLLWPVEAILLLASRDSRRLGDRLCGTVVKRK